MLEESISSLITNQNGIYVDGTFGRGGHSRKILERISLKGSLFSYDLDPEAKLEVLVLLLDLSLSLIHI